jgi:hypothetical protein
MLEQVSRVASIGTHLKSRTPSAAAGYIRQYNPDNVEGYNVEGYCAAEKLRL